MSCRVQTGDGTGTLGPSEGYTWTGWPHLDFWAGGRRVPPGPENPRIYYISILLSIIYLSLIIKEIYLVLKV